MSKKNKKNNSFKMMSFDDMFGMPQAKEGDFRFFQKNNVISQKKWWGTDEDYREGPKVLQRYDGKEWCDIPTEYEYNYVN